MPRLLVVDDESDIREFAQRFFSKRDIEVLTKVIIVTGSEDEKTVSEANQWGINGFIHKPLILEELEKIVLEQLRGHG